MNDIKTITFSHDYEKLPENWERTELVLLAAIYIPDMKKYFENLPQLLEFDIRYRGENGHYDLSYFNKGILLILFHINSCKIFSTIRSYSFPKWKYYLDSVNKMFTLVKKNDTRKN